MHGRGGFSLAEILVSITIVALLTAMVVPTILGRIQSARGDAIIGELQSLQNGILLFYRDVGRYPRRLDLLNTLASGDSDSCGIVLPSANFNRFRGPYINRSIVMVNYPTNTRYVLATGDSIESDLTRVNITTATGTQRVLQISVLKPESAVEDDIDRKVDGVADSTHGIILYNTGTLKWTIPIRTGGC